MFVLFSFKGKAIKPREASRLEKLKAVGRKALARISNGRKDIEIKDAETKMPVKIIDYAALMSMYYDNHPAVTAVAAGAEHIDVPIYEKKQKELKFLLL